MRYNNLEHFREVLRDRTPALGCCVTFSDPAVTEIAAEAGFDFCWIDGEHGELDRHTAMLHIMALKGSNCAPFYRVPSCNHTEIKKVIDFAPAGIIVPMVMNEADAALAVSACRYPPLGNRGCGFRRGNCYGRIPITDYMVASEHDPMIILQIEHLEAVQNLDAILKVPGIDSILIGPYDLTCSMGKSGQWDEPDVIHILDETCRKVLAAGKILGTYAECNFDRWIARGVHFMSIINDTGAILGGFKAMQQKVRKVHKKREIQCKKNGFKKFNIDRYEKVY